MNEYDVLLDDKLKEYVWSCVRRLVNKYRREGLELDNIVTDVIAIFDLPYNEAAKIVMKIINDDQEKDVKEYLKLQYDRAESFHNDDLRDKLGKVIFMLQTDKDEDHASAEKLKRAISESKSNEGV